MLHYLDDLDSKMEAMRAQFERGGESEGAWTTYNPSLGRPLLNTAKFLAEKPSKEEEQPSSDLPLSVSGEIAETDATPILAGLEPPDLEPAKEKSGAAMTSVGHKDKI